MDFFYFFFFSSSKCHLFFPNRHLIGLLIKESADHSNSYFFLFFECSLFQCVSIQNRFLFSKEDVNTLDAKSKCMLKYQEKTFKEKGNVFKLGQHYNLENL